MNEYNVGATQAVTMHEIQTEALLEDILRLNCRTTYNGDYNAVDALLDLDIAIKGADLTEKQRDILRLYYVDGYEQKEIGEKLGFTQQSVSYHFRKATAEIAKIYADWEELTDEIQQT